MTPFDQAQLKKFREKLKAEVKYIPLQGNYLLLNEKDFDKAFLVFLADQRKEFREEIEKIDLAEIVEALVSKSGELKDEYRGVLGYQGIYEVNTMILREESEKRGE